MNSIIDKFLKANHISKNRFCGRYEVNHKGNGHLVDILSEDEGNLLIAEDGKRRIIFVPPQTHQLKEGQYYEFSIRVQLSQANNGLRLYIDDSIHPINPLSYNPYKEIVRLRYERLDNPEANKMIANLMREIGKGLYSSKQRMIFELLQNADDVPASETVSFHVDTHDDYFLIMHDGRPFNREDVEAITSAAESTKQNDRKKTGYKGIGFKSVFTDSEEVIIKSGGFLFAFKRYHHSFQKFDDFYFNKKRYRDYPDILEEDQLKYSKQRKVFNGDRDIPWQLIPILENPD